MERIRRRNRRQLGPALAQSGKKRLGILEIVGLRRGFQLATQLLSLGHRRIDCRLGCGLARRGCRCRFVHRSALGCRVFFRPARRWCTVRQLLLCSLLQHFQLGAAYDMVKLRRIANPRKCFQQQVFRSVAASQISEHRFIIDRRQRRFAKLGIFALAHHVSQKLAVA